MKIAARLGRHDIVRGYARCFMFAEALDLEMSRGGCAMLKTQHLRGAFQKRQLRPPETLRSNLMVIFYLRLGGRGDSHLRCAAKTGHATEHNHRAARRRGCAEHQRAKGRAGEAVM